MPNQADRPQGLKGPKTPLKPYKPAYEPPTARPLGELAAGAGQGCESGPFVGTACISGLTPTGICVSGSGV